ncbi:carboxypeptidase-like regulatory domain-containing protein [Flavilitoribacter nigricans]|uniref:TonB-dependent receptor n=1 Tax=Flavilitoribacter nigricans (strain ATCC 23147 / DSM 23189 / NBRC 102662 / NCIMB 1420 / SS-2) TaxID=1122177 RepID=A0A2D0NB20_FLAN2|nr:carboxypeptidase-like regulatory domain-containing protein [Flavilitoribacter nigricans]PHN05677.1 TonB-dependent receptor [Flavilitoribacter nigricans DSM 23189 = NBRC 102662]
MKFSSQRYILNIILLLFGSVGLFGQTTISGEIKDGTTNEPLIGASILVKGTSEGTITDYDGRFELRTEQTFPITIIISYIGYTEKELVVNDDSQIEASLEESAITTEVVEVKGQRISEKQKASPLTVESLDGLAIKQTASDNFYDGLGALKGVDMTAASLGFKVINTRGFNSTSPVRSLQIIDGVDNQAPGLNFSLGNFLGSSELDVLKVDLIQGASSAFYGPNAFNGVISIETKNPFLNQGLAASVKAGDRNLLEGAFRFADGIRNGNGDEWLAYKINFSALRADDWPAENYNAVDGTRSVVGNPGRWDAVNIYGDEYFSLNDYSDEDVNLSTNRAGLGLFHRIGYRETDLVDYDTRNIKANAAIHIRTSPRKNYESPELIFSSSFGTGTTVYQGDNRFSLRDILFFQNRIEFRKRDKFFIRAYATNEDAGNSYDPYFTALRLQELAKTNELWAQDYIRYWQRNIYPQMVAREYPTPTVVDAQLVFDQNAARQWLADNQDDLTAWHNETAIAANARNILNNTSQDFFIPGTARFQSAFDSITSLKNNEGGTRFFDKSSLYHVHGEYTFNPTWAERIVVGANYRMYRPVSEGTVFKDTAGVEITNSEFGIYTGFEKKFTRKWILSGTVRIDKNQNFDLLVTPAASIVWSPDVYNYFRISFSSAIRNPTLADQYLNLNVGRAILVGNLEGYQDLITVESLRDYFSSNLNREKLVYFDVDPVRPEKVKTVEAGYRTTLFEKLYLDLGYYYSFYNDFIGYNIGVDAEFGTFGIPTSLQAYRVAANSLNEVTTQGFSIGANYYFANYYMLAGNYSWNKLNKAFPDDPIIPAFNTPEHKYNISISGRNVPLNLGFTRINNFGFNLNYKWIQGFVFEGSPQFTGDIPDYSLLDGQINVTVPKINTTFKLGASNILDNKTFQTYGGPRIGRLAYFSITYNFEKRIN